MWLVQTEPRRFGLHVTREAFERLVAGVARLLVAAKRLGHIAIAKAIDPDHAGFQRLDHAVGAADVAGPDAGGQAIGGIVCQADRFILAGKTLNAGDRPEYLLATARSMSATVPQDSSAISAPVAGLIAGIGLPEPAGLRPSMNKPVSNFTAAARAIHPA